MLSKWIALRESVASVEGFPIDVLQLIPTAEEHRHIVMLTEQLKVFKDVSKRL
jgi:hypothetical protein